ncbi:hypothetical protein TNCV_3797111 [Trichonephila clavipes]|nr:hypothetical protein TNCV_3797111 [Trichonephila clavipes]
MEIRKSTSSRCRSHCLTLVQIKKLVTNSRAPFTSARRIIKKKFNDLSSRRYAERNSIKIWWNNLKDLPMWPRRKAVAEFRLTTGHDCLLKHLHRIHVAQAPTGKL